LATIEPVKLLTGILYTTEESLQGALEALKELWGEFDFKSVSFPFSRHTSYYKEEMGDPIQRIFLSFKNLMEPEQLPKYKNQSCQIEERMKVGYKRTCNIDPGYIDFQKVVLASTKPAQQKIYLGEGVWADPVLFYEKGSFKTLPWTFLDFRNEAYYPSLLKMRELYKAQLKVRED